MSRRTIWKEIEQSMALRDLIFAEINRAEELTEEWLAARLADVALVERCLDDLAGRLATAPR